MPATQAKPAPGAASAAPRGHNGRALPVVLAATLAALALTAAPARAASAEFNGASADGQVVFFSSDDSLVPGDTDVRRDVYERSFDDGIDAYVTREVSVGPAGGNNNAFNAQYYGASEDGTKVFFSTAERLTAGDTDSALDIYLRDLTTNKTTLVSRADPTCAPGCGNGNAPSTQVPDGVSADGSRVFFASEEPLSPADQDSSLDVYARELGAEPPTTVLVSQGEASCQDSGCGNGPHPVNFEAASRDGSRAFFSTEEALAAGDADGDGRDVYARDLDLGATSLVSTQGTCPAGQGCIPIFGGTSPDGSHAAFETEERIGGEDTDSAQDVYVWSGGAAALASIGSSGGNDGDNARYAGISADGSRVFFETDESLEPADEDAVQDVYERSGGATTLVSRGDSVCAPGCEPASFSWASPDGSSPAVLFTTREPLSEDDTDAVQDVYERSGGATTLVSRGDSSCVSAGCGNGAFDVTFAGASDDASRVFFASDESLAAGDEDESHRDVYERAGGSTSLVSVGSGTLPGNGAFDAGFVGASRDGTAAFFATRERLTVDDDFKGEEDVYSRSEAGTLLISVGNDPTLEIGPAPPLLTGTDPASPGASTEPALLGAAEAGAAIKVYDSPDCSGEPLATGSAEQLAGPGIVVAVAPGSTTALRATAEANGIVSPCSGPLEYVQEAPIPPGGGSQGEGSGGRAPGGAAPAPGPWVGGGFVYVTPRSRITFGPAVRTRSRRPVFRFTDATDQPGTRFICKVDRHRWRRCRPPRRLRRLGRGRHVFSVKAVNAVGVWEPRPVRRRFKVVRSR